MAYILILGAFLFFAARLFGGRRTITPRIERETQWERPMTASIWSEPAETDRTNRAATAPIAAGTPTVPSGYLLGGSGEADPMVAMMDMMSGPGICTPRSP